MTEEQMRSKGYTAEQIDAFKELGKTADKLGMPLDEFIDNMDEINGRWLLLHSFENIGTSLINIFTTLIGYEQIIGIICFIFYFRLYCTDIFPKY